MSKWTSRHQALLDALRADRVGPTLYANLAGEAATEEPTVCGLRDWATSLRSDPGWDILAHVWDKPGAFPEAWDAATELGWSGRSEHHNALFFEDLTFAHLESGRIDEAEWCWGHCLRAWSQCAGSDHYRALLDTLAAGADTSVVAQANRRVLEPPAERLERALRRALAIDEDAAASVDVDVATDIARLVRKLADQRPDAPNSPVQHGAAAMRDELSDIVEDILTDFARAVDRLDLVEDPLETILAPFHRLQTCFEPLSIGERAAVSIVDKTVSTIWSIRKLDREDDDELFDEILTATQPFAEKLIEALHDGRAMGRQSLAADFLVFRGEQLDATDEREYIFERALAICPGHRNASMMLSYVRLRQAHEIIASLSLVPGSLGKLPSAGPRLKASVRTAHSYVEDAARVFPSNEELPEYRSDVRELADRLDVEL